MLVAKPEFRFCSKLLRKIRGSIRNINDWEYFNHDKYNKEGLTEPCCPSYFSEGVSSIHYLRGAGILK